MSIVAECANGREAIQQFRAHRPDITLMDLQMPEMGGLDAINAIRGEFPDARIIVLTTYAGDVQALRALQAGARAYLLKNAVHKELLETIRVVHAGKKAMSPQVSYELAEHAIRRADEGGNRRPAADRRRQREQADRRPARYHRGHSQGTRQEHPLETGRERPDSRGHDRHQAGIIEL